MKASLIPLDDGQPIEINRDVTVIGRRQCCDVRLEHPSVSKIHLIVLKTDGLLLFRDLGSTNGTKVNGRRVGRGALLPDDKLSIAACKFRVQMQPDELPPQEQGTERIELSKPQPSPPSPVRRVIRADDNGRVGRSPPEPSSLDNIAAASPRIDQPEDEEEFSEDGPAESEEPSADRANIETDGLDAAPGPEK